jgi:GAF domain-containing protein
MSGGPRRRASIYAAATAEKVSDERLVHILRRLVEVNPGGGTEGLCWISAEVVDVSGAGIMLMSNDPYPRGSLCSTNAVSALIEDLQFTLGEGPCVDAYRQDRVVIETDLAEPSTPRWSALAPAMVRAGARALFGFPLRVGAIRLGALNLYQNHPGPLSENQHSDALAMAYVAARTVLASGPSAPGLATRPGAEFHLVVHQAAGMVSVQLGVSLAEALVRLRARAFAADTTVDAVSAQVVARRLRLD